MKQPSLEISLSDGSPWVVAALVCAALVKFLLAYPTRSRHLQMEGKSRIRFGEGSCDSPSQSILFLAMFNQNKPGTLSTSATCETGKT